MNAEQTNESFKQRTDAAPGPETPQAGPIEDHPPANVSDTGAALPGPAFATLPIAGAMLANLQQLGYEHMTPIQAASLPLTLAGKDLIAQAKTGSGKTIAFALPLLAKLNPRRFAVQALVLCPTRELAEQVSQEVRRLARAEDNIKVLTLCGGATVRPQLSSLSHGAHVVVGTPGRILDHLQRESLALDAIDTLVLDEADRMLDMGFAADIAAIVQRCSPRSRRQTLLFSATYPDDVAELAGSYLRSPVEVKLTQRHASTHIRERCYEVAQNERLQAVGLLLEHFRPESTLAFCNTKQQCRDLASLLQAQGFMTLELHGDLDQRDRDQVLVQFANRSCSVLVATDVAARGLDIARLEAVINVDIPHQMEVHTHRVGRTGRAGESGLVFSLVGPKEMNRVRRLHEHNGDEIAWHSLAELEAALQASPHREPLRPPMVTLQILGGRKDKIRPGDVLGALTKDIGLEAERIGKIDVNDFSTYVAVQRSVADRALHGLTQAKLTERADKLRRLRVRALPETRSPARLGRRCAAMAALLATAFRRAPLRLHPSERVRPLLDAAVVESVYCSLVLGATSPSRKETRAP